VLDHQRTAVASAEAVGQLNPRFTDIPVPTEFVALIDRRSSRDHLADYSIEVVRTLRDAGLSVEILEFNSEPTLCHFLHTGEFLRLDAVVRRFPDSIILMFASAEQLIDPARQRLVPAVLALKDARRTILLSPDGARARMPLESQLSHRLRLTILRTTPRSVSRMVGLLLGIDAKASREPLYNSDQPAGVAPLIDFMWARPEQWLQRIRPRRQELCRLQDLLRGALGVRGLGWLIATTVYPELRWPLTLWLKPGGSGSHGGQYALDADLLTISRLSWFRSGWMPVWARNILQQALTGNERAQVRRVILEAIGLGGRRTGLRDEAIDIGLTDQRKLTADRVKADRNMIDYLLPGLRASREFFYKARC
jgi:hypothetical protein